jgi:ligand-binding sensor domain-containing protein
MTEDLEGAIWVGSLRGLSIFYNQEAIFSETGMDAEQILITQDGNVQILLETEAITSIEIDGGNRKWIGTQNNGVFLFSADGLTKLAHYTKENSPLPSNNVYDIGINQANGTVYFATDAGMVSFVSTATNFDNQIEKVFAFPNPVHSNHDGVITIQGLAYNSQVKITDPFGNLVFADISEGGRVVWDGRLASGERPEWGIYMVLVTNEDGSVNNAAKIAFVR